MVVSLRQGCVMFSSDRRLQLLQEPRHGRPERPDFRV